MPAQTTVAQRLSLAVNRLREEQPELFNDMHPSQGRLKQPGSPSKEVFNTTLDGYSTFVLQVDHNLGYYAEHLPDNDEIALHGDWQAISNDLMISAKSLGSH